MKPKTMNDLYNDTTSHLACPNCGYCITCGDCNCKLRQEWIKKGYIKNKREK